MLKDLLPQLLENFGKIFGASETSLPAGIANWLDSGGIKTVYLNILIFEYFNMRRLFNYINRYASILIPEEDFEDFLSHFVQKRIRKKRYLLEEGEICKYMAFIAKGAMRKYYLDENGIERIVDLYIENWWAGDRESFATTKPTVYNIEAWEDCELFLLSKDNVLKLVDKCPAFSEFVRKLDENHNIATQKRITSYISSTSEKRYSDFVERHPYFVQRFPQHLIASYLGMTKDTLSRIRKKVAKR